MTKISDKHLEKYQRLCKELLNKNVSKKEALEQGLKLINLIKILMANSESKCNGR